MIKSHISLMIGYAMIIVRIGEELANQIYMYAAGSILALKLGETLVLDISICYESDDGYKLDALQFQILGAL